MCIKSHRFLCHPYRSWEFHDGIKYQCPGDSCVTVPKCRRFWRALNMTNMPFDGSYVWMPSKNYSNATNYAVPGNWPKRYGGMAFYCNLDNPIWLHQATGKETQCPRIQKANASDPTNATDGLLVGKRQEIGQRTEPKQLKPHPARGQKNPSCSYKWDSTGNALRKQLFNILKIKTLIKASWWCCQMDIQMKRTHTHTLENTHTSVIQEPPIYCTMAHYVRWSADQSRARKYYNRAQHDQKTFAHFISTAQVSRQSSGWATSTAWARLQAVMVIGLPWNLSVPPFNGLIMCQNFGNAKAMLRIHKLSKYTNIKKISISKNKLLFSCALHLRYIEVCSRFSSAKMRQVAWDQHLAS